MKLLKVEPIENGRYGVMGQFSGCCYCSGSRFRCCFTLYNNRAELWNRETAWKEQNETDNQQADDMRRIYATYGY